MIKQRIDKNDFGGIGFQEMGFRVDEIVLPIHSVYDGEETLAIKMVVCKGRWLIYKGLDILTVDGWLSIEGRHRL